MIISLHLSLPTLPLFFPCFSSPSSFPLLSSLLCPRIPSSFYTLLPFPSPFSPPTSLPPVIIFSSLAAPSSPPFLRIPRLQRPRGEGDGEGRRDT